jgi:hypothetical protein
MSDDISPPDKHENQPLDDKSDPDFLTPEQAAEKEKEYDEGAVIGSGGSQSQRIVHHKEPHVGSALPNWLQLTKKQWIMVGAAVFIIAAGTTGFALTRKSTPAPVHHAIAKAKVAPKPLSTMVPSTLTGLPVDPSVNTGPVTAVMIENSTFARPQSGLDQAGVVFEAIAEGGITRFVALYQDTTPGYIGPIRSVRPYYLSWADAFDPAVAHVGGSGEALQDLTAWNIRNIDQEYNSSYYTRISSRDAPHNVYTSIARLNALEASKGYATSDYSGFLRKAPAPVKDPDVTKINFTLSYSDYNVQYQYDPTTTIYKRFEGGAPHMEVDASGNQTQITPKVVIAMIMPNSLEADGLHNVYGTVGSGTAYVFQDGTVTPGTWHKTSNTSQITFTDASGKPIRLDNGSTWLTALGSTSDVSYTK